MGGSLKGGSGEGEQGGGGGGGCVCVLLESASRLDAASLRNNNVSSSQLSAPEQKLV